MNTKDGPKRKKLHETKKMWCAGKNEPLQEAKTRLDKKVVLFTDDENCDLGKLMTAFVPAMTSHTREKFFEEIAVALEGALV